MNTYFIGYDAREHEAAQVCAHSIKSQDPAADTYFLDHMDLRRAGLFSRPWVTQPSGQMMDVIDGRPFSTAFSHTRFLVFALADLLGCAGPCMFVDCDFVFRENVGDLMAEQDKHAGKIGVVSRDRKVDEGSTKMDGMVQENYSRKLWSALFTFMPHSSWSENFTPEVVGTAAGRDLHAFLHLPPETFWEIDPAWHYIPSLDDRRTHPKAIHYSEFSPWLNPEKVDDYPDEYDHYWEARDKWLRDSATTGRTSWGKSILKTLQDVDSGQF